MSVTEEDLLRAYGPPTGTPVDIHAELHAVRGQLEALTLQVARVQELVETVLGLATGEVIIASGLTVQELTPDALAKALAPCPSCGWVASHDDDCPLSSSGPGSGL